MSQKLHWYNWFAFMFKEFVTEAINKPQYEVVNLYECKKTGLTKAVIKLSERHTIEKSISEIIVEDTFLEGLDNKTIRTLTYMATVENLKPDYSILVQKMTPTVDEYLLEIKSKKNNSVFQKTASELASSPNLISQFSPTDANRIGYMAGVRETTKEYRLIQEKR